MWYHGKNRALLLLGSFLEASWERFEGFLGAFWRLFEGFLGAFWRLFRGLSKASWGLLGGFLDAFEGFLGLFGGFLGAFWRLFQKAHSCHVYNQISLGRTHQVAIPPLGVLCSALLTNFLRGLSTKTCHYDSYHGPKSTPPDFSRYSLQKAENCPGCQECHS